MTTAYLALVGCDQAVEAPPDTAWQPATEPLPLAFDHDELLAAGIDRLRGKLTYSNIAFALVPQTSTLAQLRTA